MTLHTPVVAVLLDLDGTLVDSIPDLAAAANAMRVELDMPPLGLEVLATFVGKGMDYLVRRTLAGSLHVDALPGDDPGRDLFARGRASFRRHYALVNGDMATVYDGVIEGLRAMQDQGLKLAVVTNKPTEFTGPLLSRVGLAGFFPVVVCGDTCARRKPDPELFLRIARQLGVPPRSCVYVGDGGGNELTGASGCGMRAYMLQAADWGDNDAWSREDGWPGPFLSSLADVPALFDPAPERPAPA